MAVSTWSLKRQDGCSTGRMWGFSSTSMSDRFSMIKLNSSLSRRDFMNFCSLGMAGVLLPTNLLTRLDTTDAARRKERLLGRVLQDRYPLYEALSVKSDVICELTRDSVHEITGISICEDDTSANCTWYELNGGGYAHSMRIQPVRMQFNAPGSIIPSRDVWARSPSLL
jgi:hypothetical protein